MIWLASGSPRRKQLLEWSGLQVEVHPANIDESRHPNEAPELWAQRLATTKAASGPPHAIVLGADTIVHIDDAVFEKPRSRQEAVSHLQALSGCWHRVTTGVHLRHQDWHHTFAVHTRVRMRQLSDYTIRRYVDSGECDDKAGAYAIQGIGGSLVAEVQGSWTNVMGLPLERTLASLEQR